MAVRFMSFDNSFFKASTPYPLALFRILAAGYFLLRYNALKEEHLILINGINFEPYTYFKFLDGPLPESLLSINYNIWLVLTAFVFVGFFTRTSLVLWLFSTILFIGYQFNFGKVNHSLHMITQCMLILSVSRCSDVWSVDSWLRKKKPQKTHWKYTWPLALIKLNVVFSMFVLGAQKLYFSGFEWFSSEQFYTLIFTNPSQTSLAQWVLDQPLWVTQALAGFALIVVELFAPLALFRPFNKIYPLFWTGFHVSVMLLFGGHLAFLSQAISYLYFYDIEGLLKKARRAGS